MIHFFRDILDGPVYLIFVALNIIFIMAIIGFIMERKKLEKEEKDKIVVVKGTTPIEAVRTREVVLNTTNNQSNLVNNSSDVQEEKESASNDDNIKATDVAQVIDFGSTKDVDTEN